MTHFSPKTVEVVLDADVERLAADDRLDLTVLRAAALDDVHVRHDLDAAHERLRHRLGEAQHLVQRAVGAVADAHAIVERFDVHVGRAVAHRLLEDERDDLHDRRVLVDDRLGRSPRRRARPRASRTARTASSTFAVAL